MKTIYNVVCEAKTIFKAGYKVENNLNYEAQTIFSVNFNAKIFFNVNFKVENIFSVYLKKMFYNRFSKFLSLKASSYDNTIIGCAVIKRKQITKI